MSGQPAGAGEGRAVAWLRVLAGTVWRLAWQGDLPGGVRTRALALFGEHLQGAYANEDERPLAILGSTWAALALDEDPLGTAFQVGDLLPEPLGDALRGVLDLRGSQPALAELWRPVRFAEARRRLGEFIAHQPNLRASPGPELFKEARDDVHTLLRAAADPRTPPPADLKLLTADVEAWASEPRGTHQLLRGVKVWNTLVEWLRRMQDAARDAVRTWTHRAGSDAPVGAALLSRLPAWFPADAELAAAWMHDLRLEPDEPVPALLEPAAALSALSALAIGLERYDRTALVDLVDELLASDPSLEEPGWSVEARATLAALGDEVDALQDRARRRARVTRRKAARARLDEVVEQLEEARANLRRHRSREAVEWVGLARATLDAAVADAELAALEEQASVWWSRLDAAGCLPEGLRELPAADPDDPAPLADAVARLEEAWRRAVLETTAALEAVDTPARYLHGERDRRLAEEALAMGRAALEADDLRRARRTIEQVQRLLEGAFASLEERLDPGLKQLLHRGRRARWSLLERHGFEAELARARDRADVGLPVMAQRTALTELLAAIEQGTADRLTLLAVGTPEGRLRAVAWWHAAVPVDPARFPDGLAQVGTAVAAKLYLVEAGGSWEKLPARRDRFLPVVAAAVAPGADGIPPHLRGWTGRFYLEDKEGVTGPWVVDGDRRRPADPRGLVGRIKSQDFWDLFGVLPEAAFGKPERHVVDPPGLADLVSEGGRLVDCLSEDRARHWLDALLDGAADLPVDRLEAAMEHLAAMNLPAEVLAQRVQRLAPVLGAARALEGAREAAVSSWLASPAGGDAIAQAAAALVRERRELLDAAVLAEQARLDEELRGLQEERARAVAALAEVRAEVDAAAALRDDARFALLAKWGLGAAAAPARPARAPTGLAPEALRGVTNLGALADDTARALEHDRDEVANLILSLATGWWTLLAGPPGVGKSSWVRRLLHRLGHGSGTPGYLELVVRRDWQDDAALFGFWHPGEHRWEPSSEGLVERLLEAARAWELGRSGLFCVLVEELNLASPEYYLARPISALEDASPRVRLYGDELSPTNAGAYPASFPVHPNVRWVGTVNIDDTVERLSPRLLSRTAVVHVEPDVDRLLRGGEPPLPEPDPVSWRDVLTLAQAPALPPLGVVADVARAMHDARIPGAPSPRSIAAVRRYLAAAEGVLAPRVAADFQVAQRLLPGLRAVGPRYRDVFDRLGDRLEHLGLARSAARVRAVRAHGEEMGDFYDAFHG